MATKRFQLLVVGLFLVVASHLMAAQLDGTYLTEITGEFVTPHGTLARPYARGPLRLLFVMPWHAGARELVELRQRLDFQYENVNVYGHWTLSRENWYQSQVKNLSTRAVIERLQKKLEQPYDVIVFGNVPFRLFEPQQQFWILDRVVKGTGLVFAYEARSGQERMFKRPITDDREAMLAGLPLKTLPWLAGPFQEYAGCRSAGEIPQKLVRTYRLGKGRIAVVDWGEPPRTDQDGATLTPQVPFSFELYNHYDYYLSVVARVILWAAGPQRQPLVTFAEPTWPSQKLVRSGLTEQFLTLRIINGYEQALDAALELQWREHGCGLTEHSDTRKLRLKPGTNELKVAFPLLKQGRHFLDVKVRSGAGVENWGSWAFRVHGRHRVSLSLDREVYRRNEMLSGRATIPNRAPLEQETHLCLSLWDDEGREFFRRNYFVQPEDVVMPFSVPLAGTATNAVKVRADLLVDGKVVSADEKFLLALMAPEDFWMYPSLIWGGGDAPGLIGHYLAKQLRRAGFNLGYVGPRMSAENIAAGDFLWVPYSTRIWEREPADGVRCLHHPAWPGNASFTNERYRAVMAERVRRVAARCKRLGSNRYTLGDENNFRFDSGYSPSARKAFRQFLKREYPSLKALNEEWGTEFESWEKVEALRDKEAVEAGKTAMAIDHRRYLDSRYAEFHHFLADAIRAEHPGAKVGAEGSQPGNMEWTVSGLEIWAPYWQERDVTLLRSIADPSVVRGNWWGGYVGSHGGRDRTLAHYFWRQLFDGANCNFVFAITGVEGIMTAGLDYAPHFKWVLPDLKEIYGGIGHLLARCRPRLSGVAVHYSRTSELCAGLGRNRNYLQKVQTQLLRALERCHVTAHMVTTTMLEEGRWHRDPAVPPPRLLFLCESTCLSEREILALEQYVKGGGVLVADVRPAGRTFHGALRPAARLDALFGVQANDSYLDLKQASPFAASVSLGSSKLKVEAATARVERGVRASGAVAKGAAGETPLFLVHSAGLGRALLLNVPLADLLGKKDRSAADIALVKALLGWAGVGPDVKLSSPDELAGYFVRFLDGPGVHVLGVSRRRETEGISGSLKVELPREMFVIDVRCGKSLGRQRRLELQLERGQVCVFTLYEEEPTGVQVHFPERASAGDTVMVTVSRGKGPASGGLRVVRLEVFRPDGQEAVAYRRVAVLEPGQPACQLPLRLAANDPEGQWKARVVDVTTGQVREGSWPVKPFADTVHLFSGYNEK